MAEKQKKKKPHNKKKTPKTTQKTPVDMKILHDFSWWESEMSQDAENFANPPESFMFEVTLRLKTELQRDCSLKWAIIAAAFGV